ncbi:hypothetical protein DFJ67_2838 [Asanoa ferruginea]|uniref:Septum formation initiator n=1 Tax=Asanoa ferruginea TaxID=53367 RepID=A0A3D9ZHU6_9ACTN|nr:septum formation initiator [Asanoa ferruginea]REF96845.1 hypothetical protein DFJ67_2838 [Asanoa ferruginea]GIF51024.1 hypothetical protein Afe04nite_55630 [Asanoa ferruginea]
MPRRSLAVLGWLAVVIVATLAGVGALRLVGDSLASTPGGVRSQTDVARDLAAAKERPVPPTATAASPTPPPATPDAKRKPFGSPGGTVTATCEDGLVRIVYISPAQGYAVDDQDRGPDKEAEVKFRGPAGRSEIKLRCDGDLPVRMGHDD